MERCRICGGEFDALSFEHNPPKSAFNNRRVKVHGLEQWLARDSDGKLPGGKFQQRGAGSHTLCRDCNSETGTRYVPEYSAWARRGVYLLRQLPPAEIEDRDPHPKVATIGLRGVYPLRFIKQVVGMILSANGSSFGDAHPALRRFVREKHDRVLPGRYTFYLALYRGPSARSSGLSGSMHLGTGAEHFVSEVAFPPFSLILSLDEEEPFLPHGDITFLKSYQYDQQVDLELTVLVGFGHTVLPGDFRSKAAIEQDRTVHPGNPAPGLTPAAGDEGPA